MKVRTPTNTDNYRFLLPCDMQPYMDSFTRDLSQQGYAILTIEGYYRSISHFSTWLYKQGVPLRDVNENVVATFAEHHCHCIEGRSIKKVSCKYVTRIRHFIFYLNQQGIISCQDHSTHIPIPSILVEFKELLCSRGLAPSTIDTYMREISELLPYLGNNPNKYDPKLIRQVISNVSKKCSLPVIKKLTVALKSYLRFLALEGKCPPHLEAAVPSVAQWKLSSLPKYITADELESVITSSNIPTKQGLRDHAILLLLGRLGLRAGDVINMRLDDINWDEGTIRLCGKGRRESLLPLPQEVGDALLSYLEKGRPSVPIQRVFLCLNAPFRGLSLIGSVSSIVSAGLSRANITNPPTRGANLLRHSAATAMLRNGCTLETVSSVLRHRSLDMTGYYAKVDVNMLMKIAQPWPEGAPC